MRTGANRRRADRVRARDYEEKRDEYLAINVQEIFDRFRRIMTVFIKHGAGFKKRIIREHQNYATKLLPGFELSVGKLLALAGAWEEREDA